MAISILGQPLTTISLIDLVTEGEAKEFLKSAQEAFEKKDYRTCLIECRKSLFVSIEHYYDIAPFEKATSPPSWVIPPFSKAPFYAQNKGYIESNVNEPTDYIVYDHDDLELEFLKLGIDRLSYWNVWRLTPEVYRRKGEKEWVVKEEFQKLEKEGIAERAEYVLDTTINLFVSMDQKRKALKSVEWKNYYVTLHKPKVPLYEKADKTSKILGYTPEELEKLYVEYYVPGLKGEGIFWKVAHFEDGLHLWGYIHNDDLNEK